MCTLTSTYISASEYRPESTQPPNQQAHTYLPRKYRPATAGITQPANIQTCHCGHHTSSKNTDLPLQASHSQQMQTCQTEITQPKFVASSAQVVQAQTLEQARGRPRLRHGRRARHVEAIRRARASVGRPFEEPDTWRPFAGPVGGHHDRAFIVSIRRGQFRGEPRVA